MSEVSKIVSGAILGLDTEVITVNSRLYRISPPTIARIAGAAYRLSSVKDGNTLKEVLETVNGAPEAAKALSWFITGDESLTDELMEGTYEEIVRGLETAYSLVSAGNFMRLSALAKSVANLTAKPKP